MYVFFSVVVALGSLTGSLLVARQGPALQWPLVAGAQVFGLLEIAGAFAPTPEVFALLLSMVGVMGLYVLCAANAAVQIASAEHMRGRVMGLYSIALVGGSPLGAPLLGWITEVHGARTGFAFGGLVSLASATLIGLAMHRLVL